jgi:hypothetical protein
MAKFTTLTPLSSDTMYEYIVACLLKARIVEPEETFIAREQHGNSTRLGAFICGPHHVFTATGMYKRIMELLEVTYPLVREDVTEGLRL